MTEVEAYLRILSAVSEGHSTCTKILKLVGEEANNPNLPDASFREAVINLLNFHKKYLAAPKIKVTILNDELNNHE